MQEKLKRVVDWAEQFFDLYKVNMIPSQYEVWSNTGIAKGCLLYTSEASPGDVLHELGHIALTPYAQRCFLAGLLGVVRLPALSDTAVIGWSCFVCLQLPPVNNLSGGLSNSVDN